MAQILITAMIIIFLNIALFICVAIPISANFHSSATTNDNTSVVSRAEWYALLDLKARIKKTDTSDVLLRAWNANNSLNVCKSWTGVKCTRSGRHIASINLAGFGLVGSLSPHLGNLTFISTLDLSSNQFSEGIPPQLSTCSSLQVLDLNNNSLTGPIPQSLGYLSSLQVLRLCQNNLSGPIPLPLFTNCSSLLKISLCSNSLMGSIPASDNYGWHLPKLQYLLLWGNHLTGPIPRSLGNCSNLESLMLHSNQLSGVILNELCACSSLQVLGLDYNNLTGPIPRSLGNCSNLEALALDANQLSGVIPNELSACSSLQFLGLNYNNLTGPIPQTLGYLSNLQVVRMCHNSLSGPIPVSLFTNCSSLITISLCSNSLMGSIPASDNYGSLLPRLQSLLLWDNHLTGPIPRYLGNCSNLEHLELRSNQLSGVIPSELCSNSLMGSIPASNNYVWHRPTLQFLYLWDNQLTGLIPRNLGNCSNLKHLELDSNQLSGPIPKELGHLDSLLGLGLSENKLTGPIPSALANCTQLKRLQLSSNQLIGFIPNELMKLKHLSQLISANNQLEGPLISASFSNMTSLLLIELSSNRFSGPIPGDLPQGLQYLQLGYNQFSGLIPWEYLCNITTLNILSMAYNNLTGSFTSQLPRLLQLQYLYLNHNFLQGSIPDFEASIGTLLVIDLSFNQLNGTLRSENLGIVLKNVISLNFSNNGLSGELPPWLGELMMVQEMQLSHNHFVGGIPESLGDCKELFYFDLSDNNLVGEIPSQLGAMSSLKKMDLSSNYLTGSLPSALAQLQSLEVLNVSFNDLKGPIPVQGVFKHLDARSFQGNPGLCGQLIHKPCNIHRHAQLAPSTRSVLIALASLFITTIVIACFIIHIYRNSTHQKDNVTQHCKIPSEKLRRFSAVELLESTDSYSDRNFLGEGAHSEVYKGVLLASGEMFAVKKFRDLHCVREVLLQEVHIMNKIRHRNLVKVMGYALNAEVHAIVLEFMPHGSLEKYLQECKKTHTLSLTMIVKIAQGVANALAYLHHEYDVASIIHGDVKPSNILLNSEFEACLADFGLAKHTKGDMGTVTLSSDIKGSLGYMAPEFAYATKITPKVDIYSFGVVVLEMLTGMEPTHERLHGVTLHEWIKHIFLSEDGVKLREIVHPSLLLGSSSNNFDESRVRVLLQMALACTEVLPNKRPTMHDMKEFLDSLPIL